MAVQTLQELLESVASKSSTGKIISYSLGDTKTPKVKTYIDILAEAQDKSNFIRSLHDYQAGSVVLLHLNDYLDTIIWFWATLYAGCLPAISTQFSNNTNHRIRHIEHLSKMLKQPLCITSGSSLEQFSGQEYLRPTTIEALEGLGLIDGSSSPCLEAFAEDTAVLMLTSGSTGNAKAVCLTHEQILAAVAGKSAVVELPSDGSFLNWIALDHVASMVEIHIQALFLGVDQIHVHAADIITNPLEFIHLIDHHRVSRTFAPNFFLARLGSTLENVNESHHWDLSCLRYLASGGEANVTKTCSALTRLLKKYGAPERSIVTGFGMTETCAGSIFNTECPAYDIEKGLEYCSVGKCMNGIEMRIANCSSGEIGDLELNGHVVFKEYFNNPTATADAFTNDGWFKTGDRAFIDASGYLNLVGRSKDTLIVNGVKYNPNEVEAAIDEAEIPGVTTGFTVAFSSLRTGSQTEEICMVYLPDYSDDDVAAHRDTISAISRIVMLQTGAHPHVLPLDRKALQKSTLGKLSRAKIKKSFERGEYKVYEETNEAKLAMYRNMHHGGPANQTEEKLMRIFASALQLGSHEGFGVTTPVFEIGITSIELIRLKRNIEEHLDLISPIPVATLMSNPTVRSLAAALQVATAVTAYDPIVVIQPKGTKQPLWLVHPGVGEVLVFLKLATYFTDRPVYVFRARGFNKGEPYFTSIEDAVTVYHSAMKRKQPYGPYLLAGYSYGSMLAFEVAKVLESNGDQVGFLGVFNLPPHIKVRMRQLNWVECILHLSYFLDLINESRSRILAIELESSPKEEVLATILTEANPIRLAELSLSPIALIKWANLAYSLQSMAVDYEPSGSLSVMDVFYCTPLAIVAASREEWLREHLSLWKDFVVGEIVYHEVGGEHYTMLGKDHVFQFQRTLKYALKARGF